MLKIRSLMWLVALCSAACGRGGFDSSTDLGTENSSVSPDDNQTVPDPVDVTSGVDEGCPADQIESIDGCVIDTCSTLSPWPCSENAACVNLPDGYKCECLPGFEGDGETCTDIDECITATCGDDALCMDGLGTFTCECVPPLVGDGIQCTACGNGICDGSEGCASCPEDCGVCSTACFDGACSVTGARLVEASTALDRGALSDGDTVDVAMFPAGFGIVVDVEPPIVGSVQALHFGRPWQIQNSAPYGFKRTNLDADGSLVSTEPVAILPGTHTFEFIPFGAPDALADSGRSWSLSLTIPGEKRLPIVRDSADAVVGKPSGGFIDNGKKIDLGFGYGAFRFIGTLFSRNLDYDVFLRFVAAEDSGEESCRIAIKIQSSLNNVTPAFPDKPTGDLELIWDLPPFLAGQVYESQSISSLVGEALDSIEPSDFAIFVVTERLGDTPCSRAVVARDQRDGFGPVLRVVRQVIPNP